jgi:hypothetical protein
MEYMKLSRFTEHNIIRIFALLIFLAAMAGPWVFDRVYVPAKYACDYRLKGDFCGVPMSGFQVLSWSTLGIGSMFVTSGDRPRFIEYLIVLVFLFPIFPFISNLLMILKQNSRRLQITNCICWGLACLLVFPVLIPGLNAQANHLWGFWLYIVLTGIMVCMEGMFLKRTRLSR